MTLRLLHFEPAMGGNLQLDPEIRPQRLSKPRTSTSTSNLLNFTQQKNETPSPLTPTDTHVLGENATTVTSPTGEVRSRRDTRSKLRDYLYGPGNQAQMVSSEDEDDGPKRFSKVAGLKKRLSRSGSSFTQLPSAKSSSLYLINASGSRLLLPSELSTVDNEESERLAEDIKEKAHADSIAAHNHVALPVDEDKHPDSVMAPIRRRSLFLPGIATRDANDILRKPPLPNKSQSQVDLSYYYNPFLSETSPLSQLAALDKTHDGRSTPSDLDYSHLGGLKLGTLRVTNGGAASPTPDAQHDYHTAHNSGKDEGGVSFRKGIIHQSSQTLNHASDSQVATSEHKEIARALEGYAGTFETSIQGGESPSKRGYTGRSMKTEHNAVYQSCLRSLSTNESVTSTNPSFRSPDRASIIAQNYMLELPGSPFPKSELSNLGILEPGFKPADHTIQVGIREDEDIDVAMRQNPASEMWRLFINDAEVRHANSETREDAFRTLTANAASVSDTASRSVSSSQSSRHRASVGTLIDSASGKAFKKADSGYNSNESLQTLSSVAMSNNLEELSARLTPNSAVRLSHSISGPREMRRSASSVEQVVIPDQVDRPIPVRPSALVTSKALSAIDPITPTYQTSSTTTVTVTYSTSPVVHKNPVSQINTVPTRNPIGHPRPLDPGAAKAHKLRKPRPLSQPLPVDLITLQCNLSLNQCDIPPVPFYVSSKHADRVRDFPSLEHTVPSSQYTDDLSTEEAVYVPIRFPSPASVKEDESSFKNISITTRLSQYSTREPNTPDLDGNRESTISEAEHFAATDIVRSPSWSEFGRRGREKKRIEKEKKIARRMETGQDTTGLDLDGLRVSEICTSPSWSTFGGAKKQKKKPDSAKKDLAKSPEKDRTKRSSVLTRNRSSITTKDERQPGQPSAEAMIADFGTVTESLGGSPYDIARAALTCKPRAGQNTNITYPYQMSTAVVRVKSHVGMDEEHAVEFSRLRSRQRSSSSSRPKAPMRKSFDDHATVPGRVVRPKSMYADVPPVPNLPRDFGQNEPENHYRERPIPSRSRSMFPGARHIPDAAPMEEPGRYESVSRQNNLPEDRALPQSVKIQPTSAFAFVDLPMHRRVISNRNEQPKEMVRSRSMVIESLPKYDYALAEHQGPRESFNDRNGAPGLKNRPRSMLLDIPPVPALPTAEQVQQKEAQISRSSSERFMTSIEPRKLTTSVESPKKDLWERTALAEGNAAAPRSDSGWEAHQRLWADRRKAAGDALLQSHQPTATVDTAGPLQLYSGVNRPTEIISHLFPDSALPARSRTPSPVKPVSRPFHKPSSSEQHMPSTPTNPPPPPSTAQSLPPSAAPPPPTGATTPNPQSNDRLAGRYEGGLSYGYEPGVGVGGSAGTRNAQTGASRKSIGFSRGYGVDLSDIPIFVAPRG